MGAAIAGAGAEGSSRSGLLAAIGNMMSEGRDVRVPATEGKRGRARCDAKLGNLGQQVEQFLGETVGKVILLRITAPVLERQHRNGIGQGCVAF